MKVLTYREDTAHRLAPSNSLLQIQLDFDEVQSLIDNDEVQVELEIKYGWSRQLTGSLHTAASWMMTDPANRVLSLQGSTYLGSIYADGSGFMLQGFPQDLDEIKSLIG